MRRTTSSGSMRTFLVRALSFTAVAALTINPALTPVLAADRAMAPVSADGQMGARFLALGIGKSIVIDLPRDIKDVLVADPKIANAVVRSAQRAYIIGATVGQTNIVFFDANGQQIAAYDIAVTRDLNGARAILKQTLPNADIRIEGAQATDQLMDDVAQRTAVGHAAFDTFRHQLVGIGFFLKVAIL